VTVPDIPAPQTEAPSREKPGGELALVFAADEGFARATAVAMHSALEHLSPNLYPRIYVLDNGITNGSRERMSKVASRVAGREIRWLRVPPERLADQPDGARFTSTTYARLLIPELLPTRTRRAVYLDGDALVRDDLSPLFRVGLGGAPLAAVRDLAICSTNTEWSGVRGFVEPKPYFNAGVLVIDVARWRAEGFGERALAFARSVTEPLPSADQDAMNGVANNWHELDFRWNVQLTMFLDDKPRTDLTDWLSRNRAELYRDAAVLHFAGFPKPWHPWSLDTSPGKTIWAGALLRSGWYTPIESLSWLVPWLGRRAVDAGRRATAARGPVKSL